MRSKVAVIVLNYVRHTDTVKCVKALYQSDLPGGSEIICVDNSPGNESAAVIRKKLPGIHLIKSKINRGFAGGNNLGIKYALDHGANYVLIINPDVTVGRVFIKPLLAAFDQEAKVGLLAPAICHRQNNHLVYGLEGFVNWHLAIAKHLNLPELPTPKIRPAQFVTFACVLIKAEVFARVGLLDDGYFMYLEDVDYCLMARRAGYMIQIQPAVVVDHSTSSSFRRPTDKLPISFKSQIRFIDKWLPFPKNVIPLIYAFLFYPYLYLLWTYFDIKNQFRPHR